MAKGSVRKAVCASILRHAHEDASLLVVCSDSRGSVTIGVENVYQADETFEMGRAKVVCEGRDVTIIACGEMVYPARQAAAQLAAENIRARVLDLFFIKPADEEAIEKAARETGAIVTVEEHSIHGGLGEMVSRTVSAAYPVPVLVMGFPDEEPPVGKSGELFAHYGLTAEKIAENAKQAISMKVGGKG